MNRKNVTVRKASVADIPFIVEIDIIAGSVPLEKSMWEDLLEGLDTSDRDFLTGMFTANASSWGNVDDFIIVEDSGVAVAGCAVFKPDNISEDFRVVRLDKVDEIAKNLGWDKSKTQTFTQRYNRLWGPGNNPFLLPQAEAIIETVGVLPEARGKGFGTLLITAAFDHAIEMECEDIGVMVIHGNYPAQSLYEKVGFKPYVTYHQTFFNEEFPGLTKYKKSLILSP